MVSQVTLTSAMKSNLLSLQNIQKLMDQTQQRLSTGKKVNSALDNPSSYFTAKSLNSRATALEGLLDTMGQAISTLEATDQAITSMQSYIEQAKSIANTARDTSNVASYITGSQDLTTVGNPTLIAGVKTGDTFSIRLGAADEIIGTKNVQMTTKLSDLGMTANKTSHLSIKVGDNDFVDITVGTTGRTVEDLTKLINDNQGLKGLITASVQDGKFVLKATDEKNAITIQGFDEKGSAGSSLSVAGVLGLDEGKQVAIRDHGTTTITSTKFTSAGTTKGGGNNWGITPKEGSFRVEVGDRVVDIQYNITGDTSAGALIKLISSQAGLKVTLAAGSAAKIESTKGEAIRITDLDGGNIMKQFGLATADFVKPSSGGIDDLLKDISNTYGDVKAELKNGQLRITAATGENITITDVVKKSGIYGTAKAGSSATNLGIAGMADNGENLRANYAKQYDQILTQIDMMVENNDTGYKGINLLNGDDLLVNFNESRTSFLNINGGVYDAKNLGMTAAKNEWKTNADIDRAISDSDTANTRLEAVASNFSQALSIVQTRDDFTSNMINTLTSGADKLTLADMDEEAANMLALQIRQQLATNSLSMAAQAQQAVLSLF